MLKRALFVGLNDYPSAPLSGCVPDATAMCERLSENEDGSPNFESQLLTTPDEVTKEGLMKAITTLLKHPADVALLYFSGHGYLDDNLGGYLVTSDAREYSAGIRMAEVLELANQSPVREVFLILDCCHSGDLGTLPALHGTASVLNEGRAVLTASRSTEYAVEDPATGHGLFTFHVLSALEGGAADILGKVTIASVYAYLDEVLGAWVQRPLFKANLSRLHALRNCAPQVSRDALRRLPEYFAEPETTVPLDPSYEPDLPPKDEEHERIFGELQKFRAARLVEPVGEEHMYYAALNHKGCHLTRLGQFYWRLAKDRKL